MFMETRSFRIADCAVEVLAGITRLLTGFDVCRLVFTGDRLLLAKFRQGGVTEMWMNQQLSPPAAVVSFFPQLQVYSTLAQFELFNPTCQESWLKRFPKTLRTLIVPWNWPSLPISSILPNLRELAIVAFERDGASDAPIITHPLTSLSVSESSSIQILRDMPTHSLTHLDILLQESYWAKTPLVTEEHSFSELKSLTFSTVFRLPPPTYWPRNLTKLVLKELAITGLSITMARDMWSMLPPGLVFLSLTLKEAQMSVADASSLNQSMHTLEIMARESADLADEAVIKALPRSLTKLNLLASESAVAACTLTKNALKQLPENLTELTVNVAPTALADPETTLPPNLRIIDFGFKFLGPIDISLPRSIQSLTIRTSTLDVGTIAASLHKPPLSVLPTTSDAEKIDPTNGAGLLPAPLGILKLTLNGITEVTSPFPSTLHTLQVTSFSLAWISLSLMPRTLTDLRLLFSGTRFEDIPEIQSDSLLAGLPTSLELFHLRSVVPILYNHLPSISKLTKLRSLKLKNFMYLNNKFTAHELLEHLPLPSHALSTLAFDCYPPQRHRGGASFWDWDHFFKLLPQNIRKIRISFSSTYRATFTQDVLHRIPPKCVAFIIPSMSPDATDLATEASRMKILTQIQPSPESAVASSNDSESFLF